MLYPNSSLTAGELLLADVERARANRGLDESAYDVWDVESPNGGLEPKQVARLESSTQPSTVTATKEFPYFFE